MAVEPLELCFSRETCVRGDVLMKKLATFPTKFRGHGGGATDMRSELM